MNNILNSHSMYQSFKVMNGIGRAVTSQSYEVDTYTSKPIKVAEKAYMKPKTIKK